MYSITCTLYSQYYIIVGLKTKVTSIVKDSKQKDTSIVKDSKQNVTTRIQNKKLPVQYGFKTKY